MHFTEVDGRRERAAEQSGQLATARRHAGGCLSAASYPTVADAALQDGRTDGTASELVTSETE